jgi:hypothetical protein
VTYCSTAEHVPNRDLVVTPVPVVVSPAPVPAPALLMFEPGSRVVYGNVMGEVRRASSAMSAAPGDRPRPVLDVGELGAPADERFRMCECTKVVRRSLGRGA